MRPLDLDAAARLEAALQRAWRHRSLAKARDSLAMSLGLVGLRWCEVSRLRVRDLDHVNHVLEVHTGKGGIDRILDLSEWFAESLKILDWRTRSNDPQRKLDLLFRTSTGSALRYEAIARRCADWTKRVTGRSYSFHCLRHTAAVRCYENTHDVLQVQRLLGHRSLRWTDEYLRSLQSISTDAVSSLIKTASIQVRIYDPDRRIG